MRFFGRKPKQRLRPLGESEAYHHSYGEAPRDVKIVKLEPRRPHPVLAGIAKGDHAYFVHSFEIRCENPDHVLATTDYGGPLAAVVGRDKAVARVAATLDFARVERTEETYDPERTALRTQRTTREQTTGARTGGGAPGVRSNLTNDPAAVNEPEGPRTERRDEDQSYEVSKVVSHTVAPAGVVKQLTVAVLIDGTYTVAGAARKFTPRPAEELARLKELVKNAVGFSEARGDRIEITSVPFQSEPPAAGEGVLAALDTWLPALLMRLLAVGLVAAGLFYVVRPLVLGRSEGRAALPQAAAAQLTQENLALTQQNPERAAQLVREWLREGAPAIEG